MILIKLHQFENSLIRDLRRFTRKTDSVLPDIESLISISDLWLSLDLDFRFRISHLNCRQSSLELESRIKCQNREYMFSALEVETITIFWFGRNVGPKIWISYCKWPELRNLENWTNIKKESLGSQISNIPFDFEFGPD